MAGAAVATLPGRADVLAAALGAILGGAIGARHGDRASRFTPSSLALLAFAVPVFTLAVAPGADMTMHVALGRGLVEGGLSPAWPGVEVDAYPRGFSALVALLWPLGPARAGLVAAAAAYAVFWAGLAALLEGPLRIRAGGAVAVVALLLCRPPQTFFGWGGNATAMALGLSLFGAAQDNWRVAALCLAGAAAVHPMGACAGALALALRFRARRVVLAGAAGLCAVLAALRIWGPRLSPRELSWIRDYAVRQETVSLAVLGDPANVATALATALLVWKRQFRLVLLAGATVLALFALFQVLPRAGLYPARFAPLLLVAVAPLWAHAAGPRLPAAVAAALVLSLPGHVRWYQRAEPLATRHDVDAIRCAARETPPGATIDGAHDDATQWIPALTGRTIARPHQHVSLFEETAAALARLPKPTFRFVGERRREEATMGTTSVPLCGGALFRLP